jgi:hypothetical protein
MYSGKIAVPPGGDGMVIQKKNIKVGLKVQIKLLTTN